MASVNDDTISVNFLLVLLGTNSRYLVSLACLWIWSTKAWVSGSERALTFGVMSANFIAEFAWLKLCFGKICDAGLNFMKAKMYIRILLGQTRNERYEPISGSLAFQQLFHRITERSPYERVIYVNGSEKFFVFCAYTSALPIIL